jgi:phenylpyruvate tautomerase PptA (4-oxalocrotonate tautomerase family)
MLQTRRQINPPRKGCTMPLTRISMKKGTTAQYRKAIMDGLYAAMRETFNVPEEDRFMVIHQHDDDEFDYGANYFNIARSDKLVLIQLTVSNTRTVEQKKALFAAIVANLTANPGLRPEDIFINLVEVVKENWSFGYGLAQYA